METCSECQGAQWFSYSNLEIGHPFYGRLFPCLACNSQAVDALSGLNDRERLINFDGIETAGRPATARMLEAARAFVQAPYGFLSIHGGFGNGKTTTMMAIVNGVIERGIEARYLTASELLAQMRETFKDEVKQSDYDRLNQLARIPVLAIDELDKLRDTPYSREIQQELLNLRYRNANILGTVLAWNGDLYDLPFPAVISRIQEFTRIHNSDSDLRPLLGETA